MISIRRNSLRAQRHAVTDAGYEGMWMISIRRISLRTQRHGVTDVRCWLRAMRNVDDQYSPKLPTPRGDRLRFAFNDSNIYDTLNKAKAEASEKVRIRGKNIKLRLRASLILMMEKNCAVCNDFINLFGLTS